MTRHASATRTKPVISGVLGMTLLLGMACAAHAESFVTSDYEGDNTIIVPHPDPEDLGRDFVTYYIQPAGGSARLHIFKLGFNALDLVTILRVVLDPLTSEFLVFFKAKIFGFPEIGKEEQEIYAQRIDAIFGEPVGRPVRLTNGGEPIGVKLSVLWNERLRQWLITYVCPAEDAPGKRALCLQRLNEHLIPMGPTEEVSDLGDGNPNVDPVVDELSTSDDLLIIILNQPRIRVERRDPETLELQDAAETPIPSGTQAPEDLESGCFRDIGNPILRERTQCVSPPMIAFTTRGGPCHERSGVWFGMVDPQTLAVENLAAGGHCNALEDRVDFRDTSVDCNPWTQSCAVSWCVGAHPGDTDVYCGLNTFSVGYEPIPFATSGDFVRSSRDRPAAVALEGAGTISARDAYLIDGRSAATVALHRYPGFDSLSSPGDFAAVWQLTNGDVVSGVIADPCLDGDRTTCLGDNAFRVHATFAAAQGSSDTGHTVELTRDTGYFWFFDQDNVEVVAKVLDACGVNGHYWLFAAGLTNVAVDLTVKAPGGTVREYRNAQGAPFAPIFDTSAFPCSDDQIRQNEQRTREQGAAPATSVVPKVDRAASSNCSPSPTALCLAKDRFRVAATYRTGNGTRGRARGVEVTPDTGYLWFFDRTNVEVVLKVLDGCGVNGRFWIFAAGLTDVEVKVTVTDTTTGKQHTFTNPLKTRFAPIQNTHTFACAN